jgi:thioredoxin reductase (NADPH)
MDNKVENLIIIGSGPAGLTAAIYAARARLNPLVLAGTMWGGQLMTTTEIENFPGFPDGIDGSELMTRMYKQAERFGARIELEDVTKLELSGETKKVYANDKEYLAKAVIIATGAVPRKLGIPGEDRLWGKGVSSCATCDGAFFRNKIVAVIGGGDSAMEEASFLTRFAEKVFIIHRKPEFRASKIMQERVLSNPKIQVVYSTEVKEVCGENRVEFLKLHNNSNNESSELKIDELAINGYFLAIGHEPKTDFLDNQITLNEQKYISSIDGVHSNIEGVFVCGDVEDHEYRQAITAAGAGCKAAISAERWLQEKGI